MRFFTLFERLSRWQALAALTLACTGVLAQAAPASKPVTPAQGFAVVIGGALKADNDEIWNRMVALSGGKGSHWIVFATASEAPDKTGRRLSELLERHGANADVLPVAPALKWVDLNRAVRDKALLDRVNNADGIFFSGGAQERIVDTFAPGGQSTPMLEAIWDVYRRGGVVAGTSAGAAIMSSVMFRDAPSVIGVMKGQLRDGKEVDRGLGFVGSNLFVDQHFLKRGRFGRMIPLMLAKGYKLGLGVDENSAAIVHGDDIEVIGAKGALLVDLNDVQTNDKIDALNVTGARLTYLDRGDSYNVGSRRITPSEWKQRGTQLDPRAKGYKPEYATPLYYTDMLGDTALVNAMGYLIDSSLQEVRGLTFDPLAPASDKRADLAFQFRLYKGPDTVGWYSDELGGDDYSVSNLYLDIIPVRMARPLTTPWAPH